MTVLEQLAVALAKRRGVPCHEGYLEDLRAACADIGVNLEEPSVLTSDIPWTQEMVDELNRALAAYPSPIISAAA